MSEIEKMAVAICDFHDWYKCRIIYRGYPAKRALSTMCKVTVHHCRRGNHIENRYKMYNVYKIKDERKTKYKRTIFLSKAFRYLMVTISLNRILKW